MLSKRLGWLYFSGFYLKLYLIANQLTNSKPLAILHFKSKELGKMQEN